jgi:hypothetical protein
MVRAPRIRDRRFTGDIGSHELFSRLCEALVSDVPASDALVSRIDRVRGVTVDLACSTRAPLRWQPSAAERPLAEYPARRSVIETGRQEAAWVGDAHGDAAELAMMRNVGLAAGVLMRLAAGPAAYLVGAWSQEAVAPFSPSQLRVAGRLARRAERRLPAALAHDAAEQRSFRLAVEEARDLGVDEQLIALAEAVAAALGVSEHELRETRLVALVAESGKASIPPAMLQKQAPLSAVEWAVMQRQPVVGRRIIERRPHLQPAAAPFAAIREHWDGSGYPRGAAAEQIPLSSRIVSVCSAYRAMRRGRGDRPPLGHDDAVAELLRSAGTQFDPRVVDVAVRTFRSDGPRPSVRLRVATI